MAELVKTLNCMVVDDEPLALALLSDYISKVPNLKLTQAVSDPLIALQIAKTDAIDLIFLDMHMPELSGLQFMKILQRRCMIIITTAYSEYALDGYENHVVDYLLKPITLDRFMIAIDKTVERGAFIKKYAVKVQPLESKPTYIFVKTDYRMVKILLNDIYYLEGARDYVIIHTVSVQILTLQSMKSLEELLPESQFIRVHKSYIVALGKINFIERSRVAVNQQLIPISDTYKERFFKFIKAPIGNSK